MCVNLCFELMIMYISLYLSLWSDIVFQILKAGVHLVPCDIGETSKQCIFIFWSYIMCICYILYINPIHTSEHKWAILADDWYVVRIIIAGHWYYSSQATMNAFLQCIVSFGQCLIDSGWGLRCWCEFDLFMSNELGIKEKYRIMQLHVLEKSYLQVVGNLVCHTWLW